MNRKTGQNDSEEKVFLQMLVCSVSKTFKIASR